MTMLADFFLLFTIDYPVGVFFFCMVQLVYHIYLFGTKKIFLFLALPSIVTVLLLIYLNSSPSWITYLHGNIPLIVPACFYIMMLIMNLISCFFSKAANVKGRILFFFALTCLFVCDLQVGYFHVHSIIQQQPYLNLWSPLYNISSIGMWVFYLPSQVLLITYVNSNIKERNFIK
ncbi:MAG TPA: hypothetical protein IAC41_12395 [Candidatus Merdenecus merdavium]|nr:hypothetical protein [Candidatus Merdenecus merdavium]